MRLSTCLAASAALFALGFALPCFAHAADIEGRNQLQLQTGLLQISNTRLRFDQSGYTDVDRFQRAIGLFQRFGIGYGRGLTNHLMFHLLGAVALSSDRLDFDPDQEDDSRDDEEFFDEIDAVENGIDFEVTPSLRYVAPGGKARFFAGAGAGLSVASREAALSSSTSVSVLLGGMAGLHLFLNDRVSLDPAVELSGLFGRTTYEYEGGPTVDGSARGVRFVLSVGLSGWLGGSEASGTARRLRPPPPSVAAQPEPAAPDGVLSALAPLQGLGLRIEGAPAFRGDALLVRVDHLALAAEWPSCRVSLLGGSQPVLVSARLRTEQTARGLAHEELSGFVDARQLRDWLAGTPRLSVCNVEQPIEGYQLQRLRQLIVDFERTARHAGTFPNEAAPAAPMRVIVPVPAPSEPAAAEPAGASQLSAPVPPPAPAQAP